ncbi:type III PLP-dependent enzyme domain-containing protein, partial [Actinocorallia lasiicapitis]
GGVAAFEGGLPDRETARTFVRELLALAGATGARVLSAGGSAYLDIVAEEWAGAPHDVIIRSGAYVTHDDGFYDERARLPLTAALELWAQVVSTPEPGLALVGMGKREAPYDLGLPVALQIHRDGATLPADGVTTVKLDDHHGYLAGGDLHVGDVLRFGISHPCTAFDKWRVIPLIDDEHRVVDLIRTYF